MLHRTFLAGVIVTLLAAGTALAIQNTGGDKIGLGDGSVRFNRKHSQPPDPLVSHKSPGRNKHPRKHRRSRLHGRPSTKNAA